MYVGQELFAQLVRRKVPRCPACRSRNVRVTHMQVVMDQLGRSILNVLRKCNVCSKAKWVHLHGLDAASWHTGVGDLCRRKA